MNFIAIDFETANEKRYSPCSIGIVIVENWKVKEKIHYLIKPKEIRFSPINIGIHGIREKDVINQDEFNIVWEKIKGYFEENIIVAHNAAFDISVLKNTLELYNIEYPKFNYICTMKLSKNFYREIENAKLNTVSNFLGFDFNHHDALDDALASANILINIGKELNEISIEKISKDVGVTIGRVDENGVRPSSSRGKVIKISKALKNESKSKIFHDLNYGTFDKEIVVFTGYLRTISREDATIVVRKLGGTIGSSVSKKTTYLITSVKDFTKLDKSEMSTKLRKAVENIEKGYNIKILNEEEFFRKIKK